MKKFLTTILLVLSIFTASVHAMSFTDFSASHWAYNDVSQMVNSGIISGYPDGTFRPDDNVTRGEFCTMLAKAANLYVETGSSYEHWAEPYAERIKQSTWEYKNWYLSKGDLDATVNRGEISIGVRDVYLGYPVSLSFKMNEVKSYLNSNYSDASSFGGFQTSVYILSTNNIMKGYDDGCFHPEYPVTRAELCAILNRAFGTNNSTDTTASDNNSSNDTNSVNVYMSSDTSVSKNVTKLKNALISYGTKASNSYGFSYTSSNTTTSMIYSRDLNECILSVSTKTNSNSSRVMLTLSENNLPSICVYMSDDLIFAGNYTQPNEELNIIKSPGGTTEETILKLINSTYEVFNSFFKITSLKNSVFSSFSMSDFGVGM